MNFREWMDEDKYDDHDVRVSHEGEESALHGVAEGIRDFHYSKEDGYETQFRIMPFRLQRPGYANIGDSRPNFVGILLFSKVHPGKGADIAFMKTLHSLLERKGLKSVPYKNVGLGMFGGLLRSAAAKLDEKGRKKLEDDIRAAHDKDFRNSSDIPNFGTGAENSVRVGKSISVGSNSWSFFFPLPRGAAAAVYIDMVLGLMKEALKPLMDNGLVYGYRITDGRSEIESGESETAKAEYDNEERDTRMYSGYIKYLASVLLPERTRDAVVAKMDYVLRNWGFKPKDVAESKTKADMDELLRFARQTESSLLSFFVEAVKENDKNKFKVMDAMVESLRPGWTSTAALPDDALIWYYEELVRDGWDMYLERPMSYMRSVVECLQNEDFFEKVARNEYHSFKSEYKEKFAEAFRSHDGKYLRKDEREDILELIKLLGLRGDA